MKNDLLILFSVLVIPFCTIAQTGSITGKIVDSKGNGIALANIRIDTALRYDEVTHGMSDIKGNYSVNEIPTGIVNVIVTHLEYVDIVKMNVEIIEGETIYLDLTLNTYRELYGCEYVPSGKRCPECGKRKDVIPIVYGLIIGGYDKEKAYSGGCDLTFCDPKWFCKTDSIKFGLRE